MKTLCILRDYLSFIESVLRTCPCCRRCFVPKDVFCDLCWSKNLFHFKNEEIRIIRNKFPIYPIFDWNQNTKEFVEPLIHAAKGGQRKALIKKIAETMIYHRSNYDLGSEQIVLIPAARSRTKKTDHALEIARALSQLTGFPVLDILRKTQDGEQKNKNNRERAKIEVLNLEKNTWSASEKTMYILVDDVVTTGSTALSSYIALNQPLYFEVWSLCYRPLLAPTE